MEGEEGERTHKKEAFFHGWGRPTLRCPPREKRSCCSIDEGGIPPLLQEFPTSSPSPYLFSGGGGHKQSGGGGTRKATFQSPLPLRKGHFRDRSWNFAAGGLPFQGRPLIIVPAVVAKPDATVLSR